MVEKIAYLIQISAPASEPVTLSEAKLYLRVDSADDDDLINRLIVTARQSAEHYVRKSLITQTWKMAYDAYAPSSVRLMRAPVQSIVDIQLVNRDLTQATFDSANYYLNADKSKLIFEASAISHVVEITYITGYGDASAVPDSIKQGMLMHIAQIYDNRDDVTLGKKSCSLYEGYRSVWI